MRSSNLDLAYGTNGNPQASFEQYEHAAMVSENEAALKEYADDLPLINPNLLAEMGEMGVKFTREEVIFTTRDATGQLIWLEKGNSLAGFTHIQIRDHDQQLAKYLNIAVEDVPRVLRNVIRDGTIISNELVDYGTRQGFERKYQYHGKKIIFAAIGTNGFIVTAYPDD